MKMKLYCVDRQFLLAIENFTVDIQINVYVLNKTNTITIARRYSIVNFILLTYRILFYRHLVLLKRVLKRRQL